MKYSEKKLKENYDFEKEGWTGKSGNTCGPRYILDTVVYHEEDTSAKYRIFKLLDLVEGLTLECGVNVGGISCFLSQKVPMVGVDFMAMALREGNKRMKWLQQGNYSDGWEHPFCHPPTFKPDCRWVCADINHMPFRDEVFDTVVMSECLEHLPQSHRPSAVRDVGRMLKKGGKLIITTPVSFHDPDRPNWREEVMEKVHPFGLGTLNKLKNYVKGAGLSVVSGEAKIHHKIKIAFVVGKK